ncbi:MAG: DNA repair protein RadC [Paludibacter sp.]|jgi:DNA repair protein RadC|nr:DNA repair protein RadC [Paludibacter sp.]
MLTIPQWSEDDRPREKMIRQGAGALSDSELLAILIRTGIPGKTAVELSRDILNDCHNNLNELAMLSVSELCKRHKGISAAKAVTVMAALEIGKRRKNAEHNDRKSVKTSRDLFEIFEPTIADFTHEEVWVALLNNKNYLINIQRLTSGGMNNSIIDVPMLLRTAVERSATAVAVAHNHPSGDVNPSHADIQITQKMKLGCEAVGIRFLDHLIVCQRKYYSFADNGKI